MVDIPLDILDLGNQYPAHDYYCSDYFKKGKDKSALKTVDTIDKVWSSQDSVSYCEFMVRNNK